MKDPNDARNISPRLGSPLWIYMTTVSVVGLVVFGFALTQSRGVTVISRHPLLWTVAAMILVGQIWPIITPGRTRQESPAASFTMSFAALLFWGFPVAIVLRVVASVAVGMAQRRAAFRIVFNAAQIALSLAAAGLALNVADVTPTPTAPWVPTGDSVLKVLLAGLAYFVVNFCTVAVAVALSSRVPIRTVFRQNLGYQGSVHLVMVAAAPLVTLVMNTGSAFLVALFGFPFAAIYLNARMSVQREHQAHHDELTKLPNRMLLARRTEEALAKAGAAATHVGFLLLDLDRSSGLKEVNDTLGHAVGDRLLQIVAHRLTQSVRPGDVVARLGGDEFAVLLPSVKEGNAARDVARRLRAALSEPVRLDAMTFYLEASVGIALYPDDAGGFDLLMQRADVAMYQAKKRRSGIERYAAEADRNSPDRLALLGDLRRALDRGEIALYFQPRVLLASQRVIGMEALVRWQHPDRGLLTAHDFIGLAKQSFLMRELTGHVIEQALTQAARWRADGLNVQVSLRLPARDMLYAGLADLINGGLHKHGLPPDALQVEIGEQVLTNQAALATATAEALAALGVGLGLNNFGTGYTSLIRLRGLGVSEVKIDRSLITGLADNPDKLVTVKSIVELARALGIRSVADGVETAATAAALRAVGCDGAQGRYIGRPMSASSATAWLADRLTATVTDPVGTGRAAGPAAALPVAATAATPTGAAFNGPSIPPGGLPGTSLAAGDFATVSAAPGL